MEKFKIWWNTNPWIWVNENPWMACGVVVAIAAIVVFVVYSLP